jgi:putative MFS transporter
VVAVAGLTTYTTEVFPTSVRATGSGIANSAARVAGFVVPIVAGALLETWTLSVLLLSAVTGIAAAACHYFNPIETRGRDLQL